MFFCFESSDHPFHDEFWQLFRDIEFRDRTHDVDLSYYDPRIFDIYIEILRTIENRERGRGTHDAFMNSDIGQTMLLIQFIIDNGAYGYIRELHHDALAPITEFMRFRRDNEPIREAGTMFSGPSFRPVRDLIPSAQRAYGRELANVGRTERYTAENFFRPFIEGGIEIHQRVRAPGGAVIGPIRRVESSNMKKPSDEENEIMEKNGHSKCPICEDYIEFLNNCAQCAKSPLHKFHISCPQFMNPPQTRCPLCRHPTVNKCENVSDESLKQKLDKNLDRQKSKREEQLDQRRNGTQTANGEEAGGASAGGLRRRCSSKKRKSVKELLRKKLTKKRKLSKRRKLSKNYENLIRK